MGRLILTILVLTACKTRGIEHQRVDDAHFKVSIVNPDACDTGAGKSCGARAGKSLNLLAGELCKKEPYQISECGYDKDADGSKYTCTATCLKSGIERREVGDGIYEVIATNPLECYPEQTGEKCVRVLGEKIDAIAAEFCGAGQTREPSVTNERSVDGWRYVWRITCAPKPKGNDNAPGNTATREPTHKNSWKLSPHHTYQGTEQMRADSPAELYKMLDSARGSLTQGEPTLLATGNGRSWYSGDAYRIPVAEREFDECLLRHGDGYEQFHLSSMDRKGNPVEVRYFCRTHRAVYVEEKPEVFHRWVAAEMAVREAPPSLRRTVASKAAALRKETTDEMTRRSATWCGDGFSIDGLIVETLADTAEMAVRYYCYAPIQRIDEFCAGGAPVPENRDNLTYRGKGYVGGPFTCSAKLKCFTDSTQLGSADEKMLQKKTLFDADGICVRCPKMTTYDPKETAMDTSLDTPIYCAKK